MSRHRTPSSPNRHRFAVLPLTLVAWLALATTAGLAQAAPSEHASPTASTAGDNSRSNAAEAHDRSAEDTSTTRDTETTDTETTDTETTDTEASEPASAGSADGTSPDHSSGTAGTTGDATQPQPLSTADQNTGGANGKCGGLVKGIYCSTRDGSASANGNGGGKATGKPCAGCVGRADNKNPPGQETASPFVTFPNNGYECDRNHGIGKGNPAHTGCQAGPTVCVPTLANNFCTTPQNCVPSLANNFCTTPQNCVPSAANYFCGFPSDCSLLPAGCGGASCPPGQVMNGAGECVPPRCVPTAANDQCGEATPPTNVEGERFVKKTPKVVGDRTVRTPRPSVLPFTGAPIESLLGAALAALATGGLLLVGGRRRRV